MENPQDLTKTQVFKNKTQLSIPSSNPNRKNMPDGGSQVDPLIATKPKFVMQKRMKTEPSNSENFRGKEIKEVPTPPNILDRKRSHTRSVLKENPQPMTPNANIPYSQYSPYYQNNRSLSANKSASGSKSKFATIDNDDLMNVIRRLANEKVDLENECISLRKENDDLRFQIRHLQESQSYSKINLDALSNEEIQRLIMENEALVNIVRSNEMLDEQRKNWNNKERELNSRLNNAEAEILRLHDLLKNRNTRPSQESNEYNNLYQEFMRKENEIRSLEQQLLASQNQVRKFENEILPGYHRIQEENRELRLTTMNRESLGSLEAEKFRNEITVLINDIHTLREKISFMESENLELQNKLVLSQRDTPRENYPGELNNLRKEIIDLRHEIDIARNAQYSSNNLAIDELNRKLLERDQELLLLRNEISNIRTENRLFSEQISSLKDKELYYQGFSSENSRLVTEKETLLKEIYELKNRNTENPESLALIVLLKAALESQDNSEILSLQRIIEEERSKNQNLYTEISHLKSSLESKLGHEEELHREITRLNSIVSSKDTEFYEIQREITETRTKLLSAEEKNKGQSYEYERFRGILEEIHSNLVRHEFRIDTQSYEELIKELEERIINLQKSMEFKEKELFEYHSYLSTKSSPKKVEYHDINSTIQFEVQSLKDEKLALLREMENLRRSNSELSINNEELKNQISQLEFLVHNSSSSSTQIQSMNEEIEFLKWNLATGHQEIERLQRGIDSSKLEWISREKELLEKTRDLDQKIFQYRESLNNLYRISSESNITGNQETHLVSEYKFQSYK